MNSFQNESATLIDNFLKRNLTAIDFERYKLSVLQMNLDAMPDLFMKFMDYIDMVSQKDLISSVVCIIDDGNRMFSNIPIKENMNMNFNFKRKSITFKIIL